MKKLIFPVILLILVLAGIFLFLPETDVEHSYQSFIPSDAQIVLTQYDMEKRVEEFRQSPLGDALNTLQYELIGSELNMSKADIDNFLEIKKSMADLFDNPLFKTLFGSQVTCALFPFAYRDDVTLEDQFLDNLLIIARPKHGAKLIDVATWFNFSTQTMSTSRYGRHAITRYDVEDGKRISGVRMNELLVMSFNEAVLRKSLDIYDGEGSGLLDIDSYQKQIDRFSGASLIVYTDFHKLSALIDDIASSSFDDNTSLTFDNNAVAGYHTGLFGAWRKENRIVDQAVITISPEQLDEQTKARLQVAVQEPQSYNDVSRDTILYHWTNQFDSAYLMKMIDDTETATGNPGINPLNQVTSVTGLSSEQIAGLFTGDLALAVKGLKDNQLVPLPQILLSLESSDIELLKSSTDKMIAHFSIPVRRKKIGENGELISWGGIIGIGSVLPAFAFNEDSLTISSNRDEITYFINKDERENLSDNEQFKTVSDELLQPSNSITYIEFARLTEMIKEMASWGGTMIAIKDRDLAKKSKVLIDELINPLLNGLSMYEVIASRKYIEDNVIIFESQTILNHGKQ